MTTRYTEHMIEVKSLGKVYGKKDHEFVALHDVTFQVPDGTSVAIIGKSGSGKSTLMHIMSGLDHPSSGSVVVDNEDISRLKQKQLDNFRAEKIGFIFQSFFVQANESCFHNVALPLEITNVSGAERTKRITDALEQVELSDKTHQKAKNLSGGQKQRLAIARAIVNKPKLLFADEPTGNLDSTTGEKIESLLFSFNKKMKTTLVIVTHDAELAAKCDMQIEMKDGKVVKVSGLKGKKS